MSGLNTLLCVMCFMAFVAISYGDIMSDMQGAAQDVMGKTQQFGQQAMNTFSGFAQSLSNGSNFPHVYRSNIQVDKTLHSKAYNHPKRKQTMQKAAQKVNYPKKKPRLKQQDFGDVGEPERISQYQVLMENLKIANRVTFLNRIIYVGEHTFANYQECKNALSEIITRCNETYCMEKITGFLLFYKEYFVHMVESDEHNTNKHLRFLLDRKADHYKKLKTLKLLIHVSNINQRFYDGWLHYTGTPSKLLEKLDIEADLHQSSRYIYNCIKKVYSLIGSYCDDLANMHAETEKNKANTSNSIQDVESSTTSEPDSSGSRLIYSFSAAGSLPSGESADVSVKEYKLFLPEYELLEFVLKSTFTMTLDAYFGLYGNVPMRDIYKDKVWPTPHDFIPYDVFERPYECVIELPKEYRRKKDASGNNLETLSDISGVSRSGSKVSVMRTVMDILTESSSDAKIKRSQQQSLTEAQAAAQNKQVLEQGEQTEEQQTQQAEEVQ